MNKLPFQIDRPTFVRIPFRARGKMWKRAEHLPWKEMSFDQERVQVLFNHGFLIHSDDQEAVMQVGDGLEALSIESLHSIVKEYNDRLAKVTTVKNVLQRRKCATSKLADRQRGLIRSWRRNNLDWLEKAELNK